MNFFEDNLKQVNSSDFIDWEGLRGKTLFLTGATGLIGSAVINALDYANAERDLNLKITALVRNEARAKDRFTAVAGHGMLEFVEGNVEDLPNVSLSADFIIHAASPTASKEFVDHPVETINTIVKGTNSILSFAKEQNTSSLVFLSSMEVYGCPPKGRRITEADIGMFSPLNLRSSYPLGKIMGEALCRSYANEYAVPVKIVRLAQTFGAGVKEDDKRIFAYFEKCIEEKKDIVLKTEGKSERCYLRVSDAVTAIMTVLLRGKNGEAYNAADESTYCSIAEMAAKVASEGGVNVIFDVQPEKDNGFPETAYLLLDTAKIQKLGWRPYSRD